MLGSMALGLVAITGDTAHAQAGLLNGRKDLDPITLASGKPLTKAGLFSSMTLTDHN